MSAKKYVSTSDRLSAKSWVYPEDLIGAIKKDIEAFFLSRGAREKLTTTPGNFEVLKNYIFKSSGFEIKEVWLRDFYWYRIKSEPVKKGHFNALLKTFNYQYEEIENKWEKLSDDDDMSFTNLHNNIKPYLRAPSLSEFVGVYKYFLVTKREPNYPKPYENELEIFRDQTVKIFNPFLQKFYYGIAFIRNHNILQILSPDIDEIGISSIGNLLSFKFNEYKRKAILIPGVSFGFDGESNPMAAHALLCSEFHRTKDDELINLYFQKLARDPRFSCPTNKQVEDLRFEYSSKK